jgi:GT2 family glycosyltransferase
MSTSIAVLMTCFNRRENTLACLRSYYSQVLPEYATYTVFLVDDGSKDATSTAITEEFPKVKIILGNGSLYWCGGMKLAWETALHTDNFDYFIWLNDDAMLQPGAIGKMVATAEAYSGIIVGSCYDMDSGSWTYGGRLTHNGKKSLIGSPVIPTDQAQLCQQINGNIVLIPKFVVEKIGILSDCFTHAMGDFDYGFRALDAGIPIYVAPHYQATCSHNPVAAWCNPSTPLLTRLSLLNTPKGINFSEFMVFCRRHFGLQAYLIGTKVLLRALFPSLWHRKQDVKK